MTKVNYKSDRQTVSAQAIHRILSSFNDFESFFTAVCAMKVKFEKIDLTTLRRAVSEFRGQYSSSAIAYLNDCIDCESVIPCKLKEPRKNSERDYQKIIVANFESVFPDLIYLEQEKVIPGLGRIDIFAQEKGGRPAIIELKIGGKNPTQQLVAYASHFTDPLLIGITETEISPKNQKTGIKYLTYIKIGVNLDE